MRARHAGVVTAESLNRRRSQDHIKPRDVVLQVLVVGLPAQDDAADESAAAGKVPKALIRQIEQFFLSTASGMDEKT